MIRFIDLSYQIGPIIEFAWFDTVPGRFLAFDSFQAWNTWEEFLYAYNAHYGPKPDLARLERLFPEDWGVPKQELPALMSRAIIATTQCDHDWHNPHITGERDFYDQGLHQAIHNNVPNL